MSGPATASPRSVLHVDMDAFFASVEAKEQPSLRGRPVVVGGTGGRGVVASASYEARSFGVHSAMPTAQARKLCPKAVFLAPRFDLYQAYSRRFHEALSGISPVVEGIGLDEAFVDVSGCGKVFGTLPEVASHARSRVLEHVGLSCAVGAGPNKLVAKLASKAAKPTPGADTPVGAGILVVPETSVLDFLWPLPVGALWGVGPASRERLAKLGVSTVGQLARLPADALVRTLGKANGHLLHDLSWGRDPRPVVAERATKSIGHEETYEVDIVDRQVLLGRLVTMGDQVAARVRQHGLVARTVVLKVRYANFTTITRSHTFPGAHSSGPAFWRCAQSMLDAVELGNGVRLLGLSVSGLIAAEEAPGEQLALDLAASQAPGPPANAPGRADDWRTNAEWERASQAVDAVRARYGGKALRPASSLGPGSASQPRSASPPPPL